MDNNNWTPKQPAINNITGSVLRSRSNSSPSSTPRPTGIIPPSASKLLNNNVLSTPTPQTPTPTSTTTSTTSVYTTNENAKKTLNIESTSSGSGTTSNIGSAAKKRISMTGSGNILPPSSIPLPPSQQMSAKKDPLKRHSASIIPSTTSTSTLGSRPSTPTQPSRLSRPSTPTQQLQNKSSLLEINNMEILQQNKQQQQQTTSTTTTTTSFISSQNTAFTSHQLPNSSTSTPSPTMIISNTTSPPPELSLDGYSNSGGSVSSHGSSNNNITNNSLSVSSSSVGSNSSNNSNNNNNNQLLNLSPNSQSNINSFHQSLHNGGIGSVNRSSSPSPTSIGGRRTPVQLFNTVNNTTITLSPKTQPLYYDKEESIQAVCRFRPETQAEQSFGSSEKQLTIGEDQRTIHISSTSTTTNSTPQAYKFSKVFQPSTTQETFYNEVGKPLIDNVLNGYNVGIIAYGPTGAGKTYSVGVGYDEQQPRGSHNNFFNQNVTNEGWGITPRLMKDLLNSVETANTTVPARFKFTTKISYLEIYKEKLYDLLAEGGTTTELDIRSTSETKFNVPDAIQSPVSNFNDFLKLLQFVEKNRKIAETKKNMSSSRSHVVLVVHLLREDLDSKQVISSLLYIADLAGSESASKIDATGSRIDETKSINKSLYALGGVIEDMVNNNSGSGKKQQHHVRYRDSKLTLLLSICFGGNSKTCMIINCSSSSHETVLRETIQSLNFGKRCQSVMNKPSQNVEESHQELKAKISHLLSENQSFKKFIEKNTQNNGLVSPSQVSIYLSNLQTGHEELTRKNESLESCIKLLEDENKLLEDENESLQSDVKGLEISNKDMEDHISSFTEFFESNKHNNLLVPQLQQQIQSLENERNELFVKLDQINLSTQKTSVELELSLKNRQELLNLISQLNERINSFENDRRQLDELKKKLTSTLEIVTTKDQQIGLLETQKQKWKSKCADITIQLKEYKDKLSLLECSTNENENEQIKSLTAKVLELQSTITQSNQRDQKLQKEIDSTKLKNSEQTLIILNLKNRMDILLNKFEIQFPTTSSSNNGSTSTTSTSTTTTTTNENNSMTLIENLFEKICKEQANNSMIINHGSKDVGGKIMNKLVEIDESDEFIKNERERDIRERDNRGSKSFEDVQSNFLKQQEEIKQLIKDLNNSNNSKTSGSSSSSKVSKQIKKSSNNNFKENFCINILFFIIILVILFFMMVGVGKIIQNQPNHGSALFLKTT